MSFIDSCKHTARACWQDPRCPLKSNGSTAFALLVRLSCFHSNRSAVKTYLLVLVDWWDCVDGVFNAVTTHYIMTGAQELCCPLLSSCSTGGCNFRTAVSGPYSRRTALPGPCFFLKIVSSKQKEKVYNTLIHFRFKLFIRFRLRYVLG